MNKTKRLSQLSKFKSHYKIGIWFNYELDVCFHLNYLRMYWFGLKLIPKVSYYTLNKHFDKTNIDKDFNKFFIVDKLFLQYNYENKVKYYF